MPKHISNDDDIIDVRDAIARLEELDAIHDALYDAANDEAAVDEAKEVFNAWVSEAGGECGERAALSDLLDELKGNGGDEQWCGDWYPLTLIRDSYFETAMDELLEDVGDIPKDLPCYLKISVDYDMLQGDYTSVEFEGTTYWYR